MESEAIERVYQVMFLTMRELMTILKTSEYTRRSQLALGGIKKSDLIIIVDLIYMTIDQREANQFFNLINHIYEQSSIILTSNNRPDQWGELLGDEGVATTILDPLDDESYRIWHRQSMFT